MMSAFDISYAGAVAAGVLSFLSPCVLPLVPAYLCFLGGVSMDELSGEGRSERPSGASWLYFDKPVMSAAAMFVLGFATVFVLLGASATAVSGVLLDYKLVLGKVAGVLIIIFGLHFMGLFRIPFLNYEARFQTRGRPAGLFGAYIIGLAFAFGWTPCIGPVLATILTVAAREDSVAYGALLLATYALGLGIPFLLAAAAAGSFLQWLRRMRRHMRTIELVTGGLLVVTGMLFVFNSFEQLGFWLIEAFPVLGELG